MEQGDSSLILDQTAAREAEELYAARVAGQSPFGPITDFSAIRLPAMLYWLRCTTLRGVGGTEDRRRAVELFREVHHLDPQKVPAEVRDLL